MARKPKPKPYEHELHIPSSEPDKIQNNGFDCYVRITGRLSSDNQFMMRIAGLPI
jgi:hypothetical protein